ncbi:MAG: iron ABC transporter permease [Ruminococcaceae bacterium]|nr:iron ABC transporter permease [Oscillospiraceae bacterium]
MTPLRTDKKRILCLYLAAALLCLSAIILGLLLGSTRLSLFPLTDGTKNILRLIRIPRVTAALFCGAALSVSGAVLQSVLANRLASPSIIGVNSGAGLAVTLCAAQGILGGWRVSGFAFLGAFLAALLVSLTSKRFGASKGTVILLGVAMNSLLGAFSDTVIAFQPTVAMLGSDFKIGDFSAVTLQKLTPSVILITVVILVLLTLSNDLDLLTLGEDSAKGLGMNTGMMQTLFLLLAAALAGAAVCVAGLLSFVGLLVPHTVRRLGVRESRHLIPLCALFGAGFVTLSDTLARTVFAPYEIPVGILLAFLGAPFFVYILIRKKGGHT